MNRTGTIRHAGLQGSFDHIFLAIWTFLNAAYEVLAEAQEMRREAHRKHPFLDW